MKKFNLNKKYIEIALYVLFVIFATIVINKVITNIENISFGFTQILAVTKKVLMPFIIGFFIAYFLNPSARFIEKQFEIWDVAKKKPSKRRMLSVLMTYILYIGALVWIVAYLVPEISSNTQKLVVSLPKEAENLRSGGLSNNNIIQTAVDSVNELFSTDFDASKLVDDYIIGPLTDLFSQFPEMAGALIQGTMSVASTLLNVLLGVVIGFYMLCDKERFGDIIRRFLTAIFKKKTSETIIHLAHTSNNYFEKFFIGKVIDSAIIALIFFVICIIIRAPYAVLLSLIIGVTNMIPYFGPFIGAVPVILIVFLNNINNPLMVLWFAIIIFALQQFDGIFLGPKIIGDSIGLRPISVIFSILVGGALFGVLGMFFGAPAFAIILKAVNSLVDRRLNKVENQNGGI